MKQDLIIAPSILSANLANLGLDIATVLEAGAKWIHFDVMDNHYVPNLTFGPQLLSSLINYGIKAYFDVHLMVSPVEELIKNFAKAGANLITFHPDAVTHVDRVVHLIKDYGCEVGVAYNPATPLTGLEYFIENIDLILLMSVNPGFGGQKFINSIKSKIVTVRNLIDNLQLNIRLEVDGGINSNNILELSTLGADTFVAGSAIFNKSDIKVNFKQLLQVLNI